jgi:2,4-dienoyl-CoA reductase-like NADH-dependent reductase (Old Yellow Enzyme family)
MVNPWSGFRFNCGQSVDNRFMLAPMTTNASEQGGIISEHEVEYLRRRAKCGYGAMISACAYVHEDGLSWRGVGASNDKHLDSLRLMADAMHSGGGRTILQIYDGGRIALPALVGAANLRAPSPIPSLRPGAVTPREMSSLEIESLVSRFGDAALRAKQAGFSGVEVHGANHYLVHQFISARSNKRTDRWGGDDDRRMNFPLAVVEAIRSAVGNEFIVGFRITPFESESGGITLDYSARVCDRLASLPLDYIHLSLDNYRTNSPMREDRNWTVTETETAGSNNANPIQTISRAVAGRCAVVASGSIRTSADAEGALIAGADLAAVGRAALIDPEWLIKIKRNEEHLVATKIPNRADEIASHLTVPPKMVDYLLSRPRWIPREGVQ